MKTQDLHATRHDLREGARAELIELINRQLADASDLKAHLKHAQWNVKGMDFFALHGLFDKLAGGLEAHTDILAERYATLARATRATIDASAAAGDQDTADVFTEVSRDLDRHRWFLEAHLQGEGGRR
jgi:starvation-inducible DNA-binding protein